MEKIKSDIIDKSQFNQRPHTDAVLKWFNNITNKSNGSQLQRALPVNNKEHSTQNTQIYKATNKHRQERIINHCRKLLLSSDNSNMKKKLTGSCFDVTMGSFDGAEIFELVGLYIQSKLEKILPKSNFGLYRDD